MLNSKLLIASTALVSLTACSSMAIERKIAGYDDAKSDLMKYNQHQVLAWDVGVEEKTKSNSSQPKTELIKSECADDFSRNANNVMNSLSFRDSISYNLFAINRDAASEATSEFEKCASDYNAIAEYRYVHSEKNEWVTINEWVRQMRSYDYQRKLALGELEEARENDASLKRTIGVITAVGVAAAAAASAAHNTSYAAPISSYTNSNRHWVNSYFRTDGTYVPGHWRTNPNDTCLDNINGC
ncbi:hypothetical protein [Halomonas urumqiensis]|uniref:hypothetical protein n=1 Tax=Halomonas urumqiensis TaxID=1684789 RepID=UPI0011AF2B83|nr:hypothetical protein [Halomonas urumqiensis]GHE22826.1 hypothetical protein GCM10017767_33470 [Halomonas urumqiensis]